MASYDPNIVPKVKRLTQAGFRRSEIASLLDIPKKSFLRWAETHEELAESLEVDPIIEGKQKLLTRRGGGTLYRPKFDKMAYQCCLLGSIDEDLASFFDVNIETIRRWRKAHPSFARSIHEGKRAADANVARKLYHRAIGYEHTATHLAQSEGEIISKDYVKRYPPETAAAIFWLKNRDSDNWKDKREVAVKNSEELTPWSDIDGADDE